MKKIFSIKAIVTFIFVICVIAIGGIFAIQNFKSQSAPNTAVTATPQNTSEPKTVTFKISGAINVPGEYTVPDQSTLLDAVKSFGGFHKDANTNSVDIFTFIKDKQEFYIRFKTPEEKNISDEFLININTDPAYMLSYIRGVTDEIAQNIIYYRQTQGAFNSLEDVKNVPGITNDIISNMEDFIIFK